MRFLCPLVFAALAAPGAAQSTPASTGQSVSAPSLGGIWVLNPALTVRPAEIGFNRDWARGGPGREAGAPSRGGRGRRGGSSGGSGVPAVSSESADDSTRVTQLTEEIRTPPGHLTIVQKPDSVSVADDQGLSRTFHPNGQLEELSIGTVALPTTARWDKGSLVVSFDVERGRQLRYTYTPSPTTKRLLVDVRFIENGREGDDVQLTYETPEEHDRALLSAAATPPPNSGTAPGGTAALPERAASAAPPPALPPGSELRGISTIETIVEDLTAPAAACGLDKARIKSSMARLVADAGFKTQAYGNEDADLLLSVVTSRLPDGACVSRYDASLVAHADATFPYLKGTVAAVEVQLLHDGGMAGGSPAAHASAVMDALDKSVKKFIAQMRAAR